jgi:hypothetical protein
VRWVGIQLFYDKADLPPNQSLKNISYDPSAPDDPKRQLDLFMPAGRDWPMVVFIHGGGWTWGDRAQKIGGADIYGNIRPFSRAAWIWCRGDFLSAGLERHLARTGR